MIYPYGGTSYRDNGDIIHLTNYAQLKKTTTPWVVIDYGNACYDSAYVNILIYDGVNVFIPNLFTPNGDGNNDIFKAYGYGFEDNIEFKNTIDGIELYMKHSLLMH